MNLAIPLYILTGLIMASYFIFAGFTVVFWLKGVNPDTGTRKGKFLYYHGQYFTIAIVVITVLTIVALGALTLGGGLIRWVSLGM